MKVMYISRRFEENICATMHYRSIKKIFGENNTVTVDLSLKNLCNDNKCLKYKRENSIERIRQVVERYPRWTSRKTIDDICRKIVELSINVVYIDEGFFGQLVREVKKRCKVRVVTFSHDIAKIMYRERLIDNGIKFFPEYLSLVKGEKLNSIYSDCCLVLNERDAKLFECCYGKKPNGYLRMGVAEPKLEDTKALEFDFFRKEKNNRYLVFVGTSYPPNLRGLRWFVDNVFVNLKENYHLVIVGRGLEKIKPEYETERVHVIGGVHSLAPYYNNADIVIAPVFGGGGMKQKTAEAFAYGRCFIGTTESTQGYEEELKLLHDDCKMVFSSNDPQEHLLAIDYIEKNKIYGFLPELNTAYSRKYSENALVSVLSEYLYEQ